MKILHLITSARGAESESLKLGNAIVEKIQSTHPNSVLKTHNLTKTLFPHLEETHLASFFTPPENMSPELSEAVKHSDNAIQELFDADTIVIDTPMYNFGIPSTLKAWIDHISRAGKTFKYSANGPEGLLKNKKIYLAIASGSVFSEGAYKPYDFTEPYLRAIFGFLGITDISVFRVEGVAIPELKDNALPKALKAVADFKF